MELGDLAALEMELTKWRGQVRWMSTDRQRDDLQRGSRRRRSEERGSGVFFFGSKEGSAKEGLRGGGRGRCRRRRGCSFLGGEITQEMCLTYIVFS